MDLAAEIDFLAFTEKDVAALDLLWAQLNPGSSQRKYIAKNLEKS